MAGKSAKKGRGSTAKGGGAKSSKRAKASAGNDVERSWEEYWASRTSLEEAVSKVRTARAALQEAQEAERARRADFDKIKSSLTALLDVEPASSGQPRPVPLSVEPAERQGPHPKQAG